MDQFDAYRVNGTPSDCVALGTHLWGRVDVVLSGVNLGPNVGNGIWHSGTVLLPVRARCSAAAALRSAPRSPTKCQVSRRSNRSWSARWSCSWAIDTAAGQRQPAADPRGVAWTRVSVRHYDGWVVPGGPARPGTLLVHGQAARTGRRGHRSLGLEHDLVSMTPLRLDLTDEDCLRTAEQGRGAVQTEPGA